jgi:hypothetical protein
LLPEECHDIPLLQLPTRAGEFSTTADKALKGRKEWPEDNLEFTHTYYIGGPAGFDGLVCETWLVRHAI